MRNANQMPKSFLILSHDLVPFLLASDSASRASSRSILSSKASNNFTSSIGTTCDNLLAPARQRNSLFGESRPIDDFRKLSPGVYCVHLSIAVTLRVCPKCTFERDRLQMPHKNFGNGGSQGQMSY